MKKLLLSALLICLLFGCSNQEAESEKTNKNLAENNNIKKHNLNDKDRRFINLIKGNKFDQVIKETRDSNDDFTKDYYFIASAYKKIKFLESKEVSVDNYYTYSYIDAMLDKVIYVKSHDSLNFKKVKESNRKKLKSLEESKKIADENRENEIEKEEKIKEINERTEDPQNVKIGMTPEEVLTNGWGRPLRVKTIINQKRTLEQWEYKGNKYLYFEDGVLDSISY
ncbi:hypothetical protein ABEQ76_03435 [Bacillus velezensis]|uniref:hypothetical protein n=1 Tax=Bacillus amyloliquefaciens group TaxID=1938374 RepID=UPI00254A7E41|nr:hypothetical protein [Bacillus amyloliquefaciens]MDL0429340.1 hypothetical protein [Bacillus amyloliquefaciens]